MSEVVIWMVDQEEMLYKLAYCFIRIWWHISYKNLFIKMNRYKISLCSIKLILYA